MTDLTPPKGTAANNDREFVRLDLPRSTRIDIPEAIYCEGKTTEQVLSIVTSMLEASDDAVIATRATPQQQTVLSELDPQETSAGTFTWRNRKDTGKVVAVVSAGTSDLPVANETRITLQAMGHTALMVTDVGVAGLHRLLDALPEFADADVVIALAGMEGALPTVLAGLIAKPIIAVPTSVGYGTTFGGATALLSMMASCAPGIAVVGIDNGYGAAVAAHRIVGAFPTTRDQA